MLENLKDKMEPSDTLTIHDVNATATKGFMKEHGSSTSISVAKDTAQVARRSVSPSFLSQHLDLTLVSHDEPF